MSSFDSTDEERSKKSTEALLDEVKSSSKAQNETAKSLDTKATTMITISATTTSLLIGFATALLSRIDNTHFPFFNHVAMLLGGGLILTIASIVIFLISARPQGYFEAWESKYFFREEQPQKIEWIDRKDIDTKALEHFIHYSPDKFMRDRIENYLITIRKNSIINKKRTNIMYLGELVFVANIIIILISIMLQLLAVLQGYII